MTSVGGTREEFQTGRAVLLATVAALGGFLFGFDTAVVNGTVTAVRDQFELGSGLIGFVVSSALLGCIAGAYVAGRLADGLGRIRVMVIFGMSWGPAVWVLLGEMFNNRIRAAALGVAAAVQWLANFVVSTSFPVLADIGLGFAYGLYTAFALLSLLFVLRYLPETRGKQLEEMT